MCSSLRHCRTLTMFHIWATLSVVFCRPTYLHGTLVWSVTIRYSFVAPTSTERQRRRKRWPNNWRHNKFAINILRCTTASIDGLALVSIILDEHQRPNKPSKWWRSAVGRCRRLGAMKIICSFLELHRKCFWVCTRLVTWTPSRSINCCAHSAIAIWPIVSLRAIVRIPVAAMKMPVAINVMVAANWWTPSNWCGHGAVFAAPLRSYASPVSFSLICPRFVCVFSGEPLDTRYQNIIIIIS